MNVDASSILGIIPARYNSKRLKGKPLEIIGNKPMIQIVYESCKATINELIVATDDIRIFEAVESFGGNAVMTSENHETGTNRCKEAYEKWSLKTDKKFNYIINIQGDEPLISNSHLIELINCFKDNETTIATLALKLKPEDELKEGKVYLTKDINNFALYFSRFPIPYLRDIPKEKWISHHSYYQHIGIYGFSSKALNNFCKLKESSLEKSEKLEQLRWLEDGEKIKIGITSIPSYSVDTIDDLNRVRELYKSKHHI